MANTEGALRLSSFTRTSPSFSPASDSAHYPSLDISALSLLISNGLSRGSLIGINGLRSSGRTSICNSILAAASSQNDICAVVDTRNAFDPPSALLAGVRLQHLLWIQCQGNPEHALRATDLLLHAGGFGVVLLDLCEVPAQVLNRIPLSHWYRFRKAIEHTATVLLVCADSNLAKGSINHSLELKAKSKLWSGQAPFLLLREAQTQAFSQKLSGGRTHPLSLRSGV